MKNFTKFLFVSGCVIWSGAFAGSEEASIVLPLGMPMHEQEVQLEKLRQFLWTHWSHKEGGEIMLTAFSKEGLKTVSSYSITGPHNEQWCVDVVMVSEVSNRERKVEQRTRSYSACNLEFPGIQQKSGLSFDSGRHVLRLLDPNGVVLAEI